MTHDELANAICKVLRANNSRCLDDEVDFITVAMMLTAELSPLCAEPKQRTAYHVTRTTAAKGGRFSAYGHKATYCREDGCAEPESFIGTYDPTKVEHDGRQFRVETSFGAVALLGKER